MLPLPQCPLCAAVPYKPTLAIPRVVNKGLADHLRGSTWHVRFTSNADAFVIMRWVVDTLATRPLLARGVLCRYAFQVVRAGHTFGLVGAELLPRVL